MIQGIEQTTSAAPSTVENNNYTMDKESSEKNGIPDPVGSSGTTISESQHLSLMEKEINISTQKYHKLEELLLSRDTTMTTSMQDMFTTLKTLSHNQAILENKLDDALKNQMNTDILVNSINDRLNRLSSSVSSFSRAIPSTSTSLIDTNHINNSNNKSANIVDGQTMLVSHSIEQMSSRPTSVRRGPGRPRKDGSAGRASDNITQNSGGHVHQVKVSLPTGAVQVSKSKRYFTDPSTSFDHIHQLKSDSSVQHKINGSSPLPPSNTNNNPAKRKRGRPPKKRTVETVIINEKNMINVDVENKDRTEDELDAHKADNERSPQDKNEALMHILPSSLVSPKMNASSSSTSLSTSPPSSSRSSSPSSAPSNAIPSALPTAETTNFQENEDIRTITTDSPIITTRIITPLARKRLLGANVDSDNIIVEMSSPSSVSADVIADSNSNVNRQQRELDKRRDSRERMLVNMKYNDREKAKSFMESNKKLLQAMREEERRKRMTALIYDTQPTSASTQPSTAVSLSTLPDQSFKIEEQVQPTKKIGISSMLNNEDSISTMDFSSPGTALKRVRSQDDDDDDDEPHTLRQLRRRRASSYLTTPTVSAIEGETNSDIGLASPINKKNDSQASLLLASPIELLCRDGFFYRRNMPNTPITTGAYLEFKFKSKEDELISLTMSQKDFVDRTKHDRMNAHFLKPDIEVETELAFTILSKTTLTEKYVNSLEYFLMEFRWENKLVGLGLKLRESKRTWQRRKALFALFEFWRDQSREKRKFHNYTILHAVKEMENYRIFINRSVSWFYNHITLLKMILYDLCDNIATQWREWMFSKDKPLPILTVDGVSEENINEAIDNVLTLDFLDDGTENNQVKSSKVIPPAQ